MTLIFEFFSVENANLTMLGKRFPYFLKYNIDIWNQKLVEAFTYFGSNSKLKQKLCILEYERLKANLTQELSRLAQFLTGKEMSMTLMSCVEQHSEGNFHRTKSILDYNITRSNVYNNFSLKLALIGAVGSYRHLVKHFGLMDSSLIGSETRGKNIQSEPRLQSDVVVEGFGMESSKSKDWCNGQLKLLDIPGVRTALISYSCKTFSSLKSKIFSLCF